MCSVTVWSLCVALYCMSKTTANAGSLSEGAAVCIILTAPSFSAPKLIRSSPCAQMIDPLCTNYTSTTNVSPRHIILDTVYCEAHGKQMVNSEQLTDCILLILETLDASWLVLCGCGGGGGGVSEGCMLGGSWGRVSSKAEGLVEWRLQQQQAAPLPPCWKMPLLPRALLTPAISHPNSALWADHLNPLTS